MTIRGFGPPLRAAAAEAKAVLVELAAERFGVPKETLRTDRGIISDHRNQNKVTYAALAQGQKILRRLGAEAILEKPTEFTIVGKSVPRSDSIEKVTGKALFAGDLKEPGMLYARILRPPAHGASLSAVDVSGARLVEGTQVVQEEDLVAVLNELPERADLALESVKARFDKPSSPVDDKTIFDHLLDNAPEGEVIAEGGNLETGRKLAEHVHEATYRASYVAHAAIETHTALAKIDGDRVTVWASTQSPFPLRDSTASMLGVPSENVRVITPFVGGGFGGKDDSWEQGLEAVRLAKLTGRPVQVMWSRAEEFFLDHFRPAAVLKIRAGASVSGQLTFWDYHTYFAGETGAEHFYDIPHHKTVVYGARWGRSEHPFTTGPWRAPGNNQNTFGGESHIDVLAARLGMDPLEFRLKNLKDPKMKRVLETAAKKFGWSSAKSPSGRGYGIACGIRSGTYVAHFAEVEVDKDSGGVRVRRVVCAQDMGACINPAAAVQQMEGCIIMGLGYSLSEEIRFKNGEILDSGFDSYSIPRFSWVPEIETVIIDGSDLPPQGGGEPAIICMGAVIGNAIFDACGARILQLPMTPERVLAAIEKA
jgi:isoquinoline 1-oxidoreductase